MPIFSPNGVDHSLIIPVFLGVILSWWMTERYGWVFSGLVVPGYLAPIFVTYPTSGVAIVAEAALTYGIVRFIYASSWWRGSHVPLFGRERFLAIVLVGIAVRLVVEELLIPGFVRGVLGGSVTAAAEARQSGAIGLVTVPLLANLCWKPGLIRGLRQTAFSTAMVLLALEFVLQPLTNFDLIGLEMLYEDIALDFSGSTKAQILIATGCVVAAYLNVRHGWDFGGILIPPLLAVSLFQPLRLLTTVVEILAIVVVGKSLLRIHFFGSLTIVGPRLTVYLFTVALVLKLILGWVTWMLVPNWNATDLFGFGYLLSTLLASKIWTKGWKVSFYPTLYATPIIFLIGNGVALGMTRLLPPRPFFDESVVAETGNLASVPLHRATLHYYTPPSVERTARDDLGARRLQVDLLEKIVHGALAGLDPSRIEAGVLRQLDDAPLALRELRTPEGDEYLILGPADPVSSRLETVFVRLSPEGGPILSVAPSENERAALLAAGVWAETLRPSFILLPAPGTPPEGTPPVPSITGWLTTRFPFRSRLEIEGRHETQPTLDLFGRFPAGGISLKGLRESLDLSIRVPGSRANPRTRWAARRIRGGYAHLTLDTGSAMRLWDAHAGSPELVEHVGGLGGCLARVVEELRQTRELKPSPLHASGAVPRLALREGVLRPLLRVQHQPLSDLRRELSRDGVFHQAKALGLEIELVREPHDGGRSYLILKDQGGAEGLAVFTVGPYTARHIEVPGPERHRHTVTAGVQLLQASQARALVIAGRSDPRTGMTRVIPDSIVHSDSLYHQIHQALVEEALERQALVPQVLQIRGRAIESGDSDGILVPLEILSADLHYEKRQVESWLAPCRSLGWNIEVQSIEATERLGIEYTLQARYRRFIGVGRVMGLWLSPSARLETASLESAPETLEAYRQLGFPLRSIPLREIWDDARSSPTTEAPEELAAIGPALLRHQRTGLLEELESVARRVREQGWESELIHDPEEGVSALRVRGEHEELLFLLSRRSLSRDPGRLELARDIDDFLRFRRAFLLGRRQP